MSYMAHGWAGRINNQIAHLLHDFSCTISIERLLKQQANMKLWTARILASLATINSCHAALKQYKFTITNGTLAPGKQDSPAREHIADHVQMHFQERSI